MSLGGLRPAKSHENYIELRLHCLGTIESLKPAGVVAGHKRSGAADTPNIIEETRKYIRDFDRTAANTHTALELYHQMLVLYPDRVNPAVLWISARTVKHGS